MDNLDDVRWEAAETRAESAVGVFYFAARTTGIYCLPTCPARRPLRKNVVFFGTEAEAIAAGFRACRRCHPDRERVTGPSLSAIVAVCRWIEDPNDDPSVAECGPAGGLVPAAPEPHVQGHSRCDDLRLPARPARRAGPQRAASRRFGHRCRSRGRVRVDAGVL